MKKTLYKRFIFLVGLTGLFTLALITVLPWHALIKPPAIVWPPDDGFKGSPQILSLEPGMLINRYGSAKGEYASPLGTPFALRSLPAQDKHEIDRTYEVVKPFQVEAGRVAPWFGEPGGGLQYLLPTSVRTLVTAGYLRPTNLS